MSDRKSSCAFHATSTANTVMIATARSHRPKAVSKIIARWPARCRPPSASGKTRTAGSSRRTIVPPLLSLEMTAMMPCVGRAQSTPTASTKKVAAVGSAIAMFDPMP